MNRLRRTVLALPLAFSAMTAWAQADSFPTKPIRILVGYAAGSGADVVVRAMLPRLQEGLKQGVIVDNKPGAGGVLAVQELMRSAPDGHTLLLAAMPQLAILPAITKVPYVVERDLLPISQSVGTDLVLVSSPQKVPAATMQEFVSWSKRQSQLFFGTPGPGTVGHFGAYLLGDAVGTGVEPIHFKTTADQMSGLVNGDIHAQFFSYAAALPIVRTGKVKVLMTTSPARSPMFPDAPTPKEVGLPQLQFTSWYGYLAPAGTPAPVLERLQAEFVKSASAPEVKQKLEDAGLRVTATGREEFARIVRDDAARWGKVVAATGFRQD
jgi:tripartite-type tricarboxylate transporter receptor subunit TctC